MSLERLLGSLARLWQDERGGTVPLQALSLSTLMGFGALAIDTSLLHNAKTALQVTADAAALGAARDIPDDARTIATAIRIASANLPSEKYGDVLRAADVEIGRWEPTTRGFSPGGTEPNAVRVTVRRATANGNPEPTFIAGILGIHEVDLAATAVAVHRPSTPVCLLALHPTAGSALLVDSNARISAPNCAVRVNSTSASGLRTDSNARIEALDVGVSGGYQRLSGSSISPLPDTGVPPLADPLAGLAAPTFSGCNHNGRQLDSVNVTINPGVYCGGFLIKNNARVRFNPGTYIIRDGEFLVDSNARVQGTGVAFFLGRTAKLRFDSNSVVDFTAPASGSLAGILVFADRLNREEHQISSNNISRLTGVLYFPGTRLFIYSNAEIAASSPFTAIVARTVELNSNVRLRLNADFASTTVPFPPGLRPGGGTSLVH